MEAAQLTQLVDARLQVLVELLALARRQLVVIEADDLTTLLRVLAGKQQLVTQLQLLDRQLAPSQYEDPENRRWPSPQARDRCRQQSARCEAMLREILDVEQRAQERVAARRDDTARRLAAVNQSTTAQRAYATAPIATASLFDSNSEG